MSRWRPVVRLGIWAAFLATTLRLLHGSTMGTLSVPAESLDALATWVQGTPPAVMAVAAIRLVALAGAWYLVVVTVATVVADLAGWARLARVVAAVSPAVVRRLATRSAGAGLVAGAFLAGVPLPPPLDTAPSLGPSSGLAIRPAGATTPAATATMTRSPAPSPATPAVALAHTAAPRAVAVMTRTDPVSDDQASMTWVGPARDADARAATTSPPSPEPADERPNASMTRVPPPPIAGEAGPPGSPPPTEIAGPASTASMTRVAPTRVAGSADVRPGTGGGGPPTPPTTDEPATATMTHRPPPPPTATATATTTADTDPPPEASAPTTPSPTTTPTGPAPPARPPAQRPASATMTRTTAPPSAARPPTGEAQATDEPQRPTGPPPAVGETWVVEVGDSFWSIAAETLRDRDGDLVDRRTDDLGEPEYDRVERYWRALLAANRDRMADPDNPDLLLPGQELVLPPG